MKNKEYRKILRSYLLPILVGIVVFAGVLTVVPVYLHTAVDAPVKMIPLRIGNEKFIVELADTPEKQIMGLMYRQCIPDNYGMLFVYHDDDIRGFWMKNTKVPLDIIHLDANKQVVHMFINVPPCTKEPCETYTPAGKMSRYVLELRGNRAVELKLAVGDTVFFLLDD